MAKSMDCPEVPPGVKYFDPRRFRRHARKQAMFRLLREKDRKLQDAEQSRRALANLISQREQEAARSKKKLTIMGKIRAFLGRFRTARNKG